MDCFAGARNDAETHVHDLAADFARVLLLCPALGRTDKGAGNAGRSLRPQPCVRKQKWHTSIVTTVTPVSPGIPRAMVLTVSFALSPVTGLSCHRHRRDAKHRRQLDASVGASGPHDFAVRKIAPSSEAPPRVHRIPSRVRDDREPPLCGTGRARHTPDLHFGKTEIFFRKGLDRKPNAKSQTAPDGQITCVSKHSPEEPTGRANARPMTGSAISGSSRPRMALRLCGLLAGLLDAESKRFAGNDIRCRRSRARSGFLPRVDVSGYMVDGHVDGDFQRAT